MTEGRKAYLFFRGSLSHKKRPASERRPKGSLTRNGQFRKKEESREV